MKLSISATNPCHLFDLANALHSIGHLSRFYSGYPKWKLRPPSDFPVVTRSRWTLATYGLLRLPTALQPRPHRVFRWQDRHFDAAVAAAISGDQAASIHALPGQAIRTFERAKEIDIRTVLNHASGPVRQQLALVADEYLRAGLDPKSYHSFDAAYFRQEESEYALADQHCVASTVVRDQLVAAGVPAEQIAVIPYAANPAIFFPPTDSAKRDPFQIVYAGQLGLRKGLRIAFEAHRLLRSSQPYRLDVYGKPSRESLPTLKSAIQDGVRLHGSVTQWQLGEIFRHAGVLVLPSWEEAFGLVVVQALACGLPCVVSDRVGAKDLITHRQNGSVVRAGDAAAFAEEIAWWQENRARFQTPAQTWEMCAKRVLAATAKLVA